MYKRQVASSEQLQAPALRNLLVVGSLNVDITVDVARLPRPGETLTARSPRTTVALGGKGANQVRCCRVARGWHLGMLCHSWR